jgi:hypothetical protein
MSYPAITTAALFVALLTLDLVNRNNRLLAVHFIFGVISVLLMLYLSQQGADFVAWGLLLVPFILLLTGVIIGSVKATPGPSTQLAPVPVLKTNPCSTCGSVARCGCDDVKKVITPTPKPITDASGTVMDASGNSVSTGPVATVSCGSGTGRTQCIDTRTLQSA